MMPHKVNAVSSSSSSCLDSMPESLQALRIIRPGIKRRHRRGLLVHIHRPEIDLRFDVHANVELHALRQVDVAGRGRGDVGLVLRQVGEQRGLEVDTGGICGAGGDADADARAEGDAGADAGVLGAEDGVDEAYLDVGAGRRVG